MAREGWPFVLAGLAFAALLFLAGLRGAALAALALTAFIAWFFRDPEREIPGGPGLIVSPADGRVIDVADDGEDGTRVSVFLSIFDVHVNRAPDDAAVTAVDYSPGRFLAAWNTLASTENERTAVTLDSPRGTVRVVQVAGLIARRIICRLAPGQFVRRGERYGLIRFGSRVDIFLPPAATADVIVGDRVRGGASVIGHWRDHD